MPTKEECFYLGKISKSKGFDGELVMLLDVDDPSEYAHLDGVFVEIKGRLVPCFIDRIQISKGNAVVKFQDFSVEDSLALIGKEVYLPLDVLPKLDGDRFYYHEVEGYKVEDEDFGYVGILKYVLDQSAQPLLCIDREGTEIMVPLVDQFFKKLDRQNKVMYIHAPEGLIDFYLD